MPQPASSTETPHYVHVWEFWVEPGKREQFIAHYGADGSWAALFGRASGYLGTLLLNDAADPQRFVTIDRWLDRSAHERFVQAFRGEYDALDRACAALTRREVNLGSYLELPRRGDPA